LGSLGPGRLDYIKDKDMRQRRIKFLIILVLFVVFYSTSYSQSQKIPLPVEVTYRKSFLGGSYVLQVKNTSDTKLKIWLDAREQIANFSIPPGKTKDIGWAQKFRFDANDVFFIGAEGYDTYNGVMPSTELSEVRIDFSNDGSLTINLSQSFLQKQLEKNLKLPIKEKYPKIMELEINEMPQINLRDRSDRIYVDVVLEAILFSLKVHVPVNVTASFVPI
jgi:hypothetical protein